MSRSGHLFVGHEHGENEENFSQPHDSFVHKCLGSRTVLLTGCRMGSPRLNQSPPPPPLPQNKPPPQPPRERSLSGKSLQATPPPPRGSCNNPRGQWLGPGRGISAQHAWLCRCAVAWCNAWNTLLVGLLPHIGVFTARQQWRC